MKNNETEDTIELVTDIDVDDEAELDDSPIPVQYEITSFGADIDAEGLVKRLQRDDIFVPPFQRSYVWSQKEASRFIESLLLGLPVPGIFLARESQSKRLIVIDGQQRLKTLQFFMEGYFDPDPEALSKRIFKLVGVQKRFEGLTYEKLEENDRIILNDSVIHATIVKQDAPEGETSSIYYIFERLNTSGRKLTAQQIRVAIYHGEFLDTLREINNYEKWRDMYGRKSKSLKDQELILRFLAMYFKSSEYYRPMKEFLNDFTEEARKRDKSYFDSYDALFKRTIDLVDSAIGNKAFRPERALNAAVFDSVMVALAKRIDKGEIKNIQNIKAKYDSLLSDDEYLTSISQSTSDEKNVEFRIARATETFADT